MPALTPRRVLFALAAGAALPAPAAAEEPLRIHTQAEAGYEPTPRDIRMCATCTLFIAPNACKVVEGEVSPEGWCRLFDMAD
jgi:hypothetical protein